MADRGKNIVSANSFRGCFQGCKLFNVRVPEVLVLGFLSEAVEHAVDVCYAGMDLAGFTLQGSGEVRVDIEEFVFGIPVAASQGFDEGGLVGRDKVTESFAETLEVGPCRCFIGKPSSALCNGSCKGRCLGVFEGG